jgi:hypothetical protein
MFRSEDVAVAGRHCGKGLRALVVALFVALTTLAVAVTTAQAQKHQIRIEYAGPQDPAHQPLKELLQEHRVLERVQKIFSPFQFPFELMIAVGGCYGVANAFYWERQVVICYEYIDEILQNIPKKVPLPGVSPIDAVIGQFFYVVTHEMGHAVFSMFRVPILGREEDVADQFSAYMMLQFEREEARRLIVGAGFAYDSYMRRATHFLPLRVFSGVHGLPMQRFYNLMCVAYGADSKLFGDVVEMGYLPRERADVCQREYRQVAFAFRQLIGPHLDQAAMQDIMSRAWLPRADVRSSGEDNETDREKINGETRRNMR